MPTGHFCPWALGLACHRWGARKRWGVYPDGREIDVDSTGLGSNVFLMVPTCSLSGLCREHIVPGRACPEPHSPGLWL